MDDRKTTIYRVGGAIALLIVGALIVVWAASNDFLRRNPNPPRVSHGEPVVKLPLHPEEQGSFTREERKFLLDLARKSIQEVVTNGRLPEIAPTGLSSKLMQPKGCFVTLNEDGKLRGCIGHIFPQEPLYRAVMDNAHSAAIRDVRFAPVKPEELDRIEIEISVLTVPQPLSFDSPDDLLAKLHPYKDGVVLKMGTAGATFLPQVWEEIPEKEMFLARLSIKAGFPPSAWKMPGTTVLIYHVEAFKESEM